ncbi:hypothetical protein QLX67_02365, partial [Balneolaceae bacterium ANBcel3]|nr:hypothetical protein [Balneolaceae bacterium ANBcel3]
MISRKTVISTIGALFASALLLVLAPNPLFSQNNEPDLTNASTSTARAQIIHNSADPAAAVVDVYVNGDLFYDSLAFRAATPFVDVPAETELT